MSQDFPIEIHSSPESLPKTSLVVIESEEEGGSDRLHENIGRKRKYGSIDGDGDIEENFLNNRNSFFSESSCFSSCFHSEIPEPEEAITETSLRKGEFDYEDPPIYGFDQIQHAEASCSPFSEWAINLASEDEVSPTEQYPLPIHTFSEELNSRKGSFYGGESLSNKGKDDHFALPSANKNLDRETGKENTNAGINWTSKDLQNNKSPKSFLSGLNDILQDDRPIHNTTPVQDQGQHDQHSEMNEKKYEGIPVKELCRMVESYGFKPSKSKRALINILKACDAAREDLRKQELSKDGSSKKVNTFMPSSATTFDDIVAESHRSISEAVRGSRDKTIWLKILYYEPLDLEEFTLWLRNSGLVLSSTIILSWCDTYGVLVQGSWHSNSREKR